MSDSNFSSLIYRIIGKPDRWHDDYIVEMMHQYLDHSDDIDDPLNLLELEAGDQILSRLSEGNAAINAFNSLLDRSRFKMVILDEQLQPLYYNKIALKLFHFVQDPHSSGRLKPKLLQEIKAKTSSGNSPFVNSMHALDFYDENDNKLYIRTIHSKLQSADHTTKFHIVMVLDQHNENVHLNSNLVAEFGLTNKEKNILLKLVHGGSIKDIAASSFVSENTVRSHLKAIFRKTDTNSQGALISLILTHESQVLDSYFDSGITTVVNSDSNECDRSMTLSNGQSIAYCDYGPESGRPIIVFHSGFGSRLSMPPGYQEMCFKHNRRIIIPDRPGFGRTEFIDGHPQGWNSQLSEFIERLDIDEYEVLGSVIACQIAMAYAAQADKKLTRLILTSPVVINEDAHAAFLTEILAPAAKYVKLSPQFAKEIYTLWLKAITMNLDAHYPTILAESVGSAEKEQFEKTGMINVLTDAFKEGARQSLDGILNEMVYCMTPLQLDFSTISVPVDIWYGTEDKRIAQQGVQEIFKPLKNARLHIREGCSEHIYYSMFNDIIE